MAPSFDLAVFLCIDAAAFGAAWGPQVRDVMEAEKLKFFGVRRASCAASYAADFI